MDVVKKVQGVKFAKLNLFRLELSFNYQNKFEDLYIEKYF